MKRTKLVLALVLAALLIPSVWLNTRTGVTICDQFLWRRAPGEYRSLSGWTIVCDDDFQQFEAALGNETFSATAEIDDLAARFTFDDDTVVEGRWDGNLGLMGSDGAPLGFWDDAIIIVGDGNSSIPSSAVANAFCRIAMGETESCGALSLVFVGIVIYLLGAAQLLWPEETHFLFSRWRYQNAELSDEGILAERIGAVVVMILAAGIMFAPLFI